MKKTFLRFVSTALAAIMLFGCMNIGVFAAEGEQNTVTLTTTTPSVTIQEGANTTPSVPAVATQKTIAAIIAESKIGMTEAEKAILTSAALKLDQNKITYTADLKADGNVTMELIGDNTFSVSAKAIDSGLANKWMPVGGVVVCEGDDVPFELDENGEGRFTAQNMEMVTINYELVIDSISVATATEYANLPHVLATEAAAQKNAMDHFARQGVRNGLSSMLQNLDLIMTLHTSMNLFADSAEAIKTLNEKCTYDADEGKGMYLLDYLNAYSNEATGGLAYYYADGNYEKIKEQLGYMSAALEVLCADVQFNEIFANPLLNQMYPGLSEKKDSIVQLKDDLKNTELLPVNEIIDRNSTELKALANALVAAIGNTSEKAASEVILAGSVSAPAPDKAIITVTVQISGRNANSATREITVKIGEMISENDINDIFRELCRELNVDNKNYSRTIDTDIDYTAPIANNGTATMTWKPLTYTIRVMGEYYHFDADASEFVITLPGTGDVTKKYIYDIAGEKVTVKAADETYAFENLDALKAFRDSGAVVTRELVDTVRQDVIKFVDVMNEAIAEKATVNVNGVDIPVMSFIAVEDAEGAISIVLRITPYLTGVDYQGLMMNVMQTLIIDGNPYKEITINDKHIYDNGVVYLQTMIDTLLSDNFGFDAICNMIDANGNIKDIDLDVTPVEDVTFQVALADQLGGKLIEAEFGGDGNKYPLYITFEDYGQMAGTLKKVDAALGKVKNYINITANEGVLNVDFVMPAKFSAYYLAELLVMDQAELSNIEDMELEEALAFMMSIIKPLVADEEFTLETIENTAAKVGVGADLSQYVTEAQFATVRKALNFLFTKGELESEANGINYSASVSYKIRDILINRFNVPSMFVNVVAEAKEDSKGIVFNFTITDNTVATHDFDALVVNPSAKGLDILTTTSDLASVLAKAEANTIIVLLDDVTLSSDVVIPNRVFINLNGKTITGNMTTSAAVRITNGNLEACGGVTGELSGNFVITGGDYTADVTSMVKKGYEVVDGCVENALYTAEKDAEGNITIAIKGGFLDLVNAPTTQDALKDFAVDVAFDIALNMFTAASMTVDGNNLYTVELNNVLGMLDSSKTEIAEDVLGCISFEGLVAIANDLLADLTDFGAMANAIVMGDAITSYEVQTQGWNVVPEIVDNAISLNVVPAEEGKTAVVTVKFDEDMADEDYAALVDLFAGLEETVDASIVLETLNVGYANGQPTADITGAINVAVDFSDDYRYAALIMAAVAYGADGDDRDVYTSALDYLLTSRKDEFAEILDTVTSAQIIKALKTLATVSCEDMLEEIYFSNPSEVVALADIYDELLVIANKVVAYTGVKGNSTTLGAVKTPETIAEYGFDRENVKGFYVDFSIIVIDEETALEPELVDIRFSEYLDTDKIKGGFVVGNYIYIDAHHNGISVSELGDALELDLVHADNYSTFVPGKEYDEIVCTGDVLVIDTYVAGGNVKLGSYVVIVLGDTNCNGKNDAGDAVLMARHYVGKAEMAAFPYKASDININNELDAGDAVKVTSKYIDWSDYTSALEQ